MLLTRRFAFAAVAVTTPLVGALALVSACGSHPPVQTPPASSSSAPDAGPPPPSDAAPVPIDAAPLVVDSGVVMTTTTTTDAASDAPAPPCWKGFSPTGDAVADLNDLAARCTQGMTPLIPPVKQAFKAGEIRQVPSPFAPACYRIIAVGGKGLIDVNLELRDQTGKLVAADDTVDDVFPMIHPNKEFCTDAFQILTLSIIAKKGTGDIAGGVWKR